MKHEIMIAIREMVFFMLLFPLIATIRRIPLTILFLESQETRNEIMSERSHDFKLGIGHWKIHSTNRIGLVI
jgi:hypothetical protein